jgi:hypothetical protein
MPIVDKNRIMNQMNERRHEIQVDPDDSEAIMEIWVRNMSFFDIQKAAQEMFVITNGEVSLDLEAYWRYAFKNWVIRTNPHLSVDELLNLSGFVGQQIALHLPNPEELAKVMQGGFTKASN